MASSARNRAFVADLPNLTAEQLEKLYAWGKGSCDRFDVHLNDNMSMVLAAVRKKDGTARDHQRLLRTNLIHWGVELPAKQTGWLRLIDEATQPADLAPTTTSTPSAPEPTREEAAPTKQDTAHPPTGRACAATPCRLALPQNLLTRPGRCAALAGAEAARVTAPLACS